MSDKKQNLKNSLANFIKQAREQKVVSYEEINSVLSIGFSTEKIDQLIKKLTDDGVQIVDTIKEKEDLLKIPDSMEEIEKMELSKRTLPSGSNVLIVDDFLKAGGTINGMRSLIQEFDSTTAGAVVFCESGVSNHNVSDYSSIIKITEIDTESQKIKAVLGNFFDKHEFL